MKKGLSLFGIFIAGINLHVYNKATGIILGEFQKAANKFGAGFLTVLVIFTLIRYRSKD